MTYELTLTDKNCKEHKDCTATTFANSKGVIGVRHLHQWLDKLGLDVDGRGPDDLVFGAWNVGLLLAYDPETGEAEFDPEASVLTSSRGPADVDPEKRMNPTYPVADDHRHPKGKSGNYPKLRAV